MTLLDQELFRLVAKQPDWRSALSPHKTELLEQRLSGKTRQDLADVLQASRWHLGAAEGALDWNRR